MTSIKVLLTCPPMILNINNYLDTFKKHNMEVTYPHVTQTLSEDELIKNIGNYDAWIAGDDPATYKVLEAGKRKKLKILVKWGVGIDNVDREACKNLNIFFSYTPCMFGEEVSDVAIGYLIMLNRKLHEIDTKVKEGEWYKHRGTSLYEKKICVIGFGDVGKCLVRKLKGFNMKIYISDPMYKSYDRKIMNIGTNEIIDQDTNIIIDTLENCMYDADYVIATCNLNKNSYHLVNKVNLMKCKKGVKLINVSRGSIIKEDDVIELLENKHIDSVAFDVFEQEPLNATNKLRLYKNNIFGSHNGSNTIEGVDKTSFLVIDIIKNFFVEFKSKL